MRKGISTLPLILTSDAFDYSYSGIELYFINGQIIVGDVAQDSPAENCGSARRGYCGVG